MVLPRLHSSEEVVLHSKSTAGLALILMLWYSAQQTPSGHFFPACLTLALSRHLTPRCSGLIVSR